MLCIFYLFFYFDINYIFFLCKQSVYANIDVVSGLIIRLRLKRSFLDEIV